MIAEDGVVVDLVDGQARVAGAVPCGYVYVDGLTVGEVTESQLKDRRILGDEGFVSVVIVVDANSGKMVAGPEIHARGSGIDDAAFGEVLPEDRGGPGPGRRRRRQRRPPDQPARPPHRRQMGQRQLPPPPHDHPRSHRGLAHQPAARRTSARTLRPVSPTCRAPRAIPPRAPPGTAPRPPGTRTPPRSPHPAPAARATPRAHRAADHATSASWSSRSP